MQYCAFDVSKGKLDAVVTNLRTRTQRFAVANTSEGIDGWLSAAPLPKKLIMGCEATGGYHLALARACVARGYRFKVINPILTKQFIRATIRKQKTDLSDALVIAKLLAQGEGTDFVWDADIAAAKAAYRAHHRVAQYATGLHLLRMGIAPEERATAAYIDETIALIAQRQAEHERTLVDSYGSREEVRLLRSIAGIGVKLAPVIWSEIGAIEKFTNAAQLVAYAGLDPKIRQSGHTLNAQGRLTKRGSPHLRRALFLAANCARMRDPELKAYYWKKRGEGKKHTIATCATARKLICRIYAVWRRRTPYIPSTT